MGMAHSQFPFRFGASQTSESSKSDLENGDHDGSVDSEEEEEQPPPPSPHKGSTPDRKDTEPSQGTTSSALGSAGSGHSSSHTASSLQSAQSLQPRGNGNGVSGSCSPAPEQPSVRQPHRENPRERIPARGRAWDERSFKIPLHPNHSMGLWFPESFSANPSQSSSAGM